MDSNDMKSLELTVLQKFTPGQLRNLAKTPEEDEYQSIKHKAQALLGEQIGIFN